MLHRIITTILFISCGPAISQVLTEDIQDVPYGLLRSLATESIDFDAFAEWPQHPAPLNEELTIGGVTFASIYNGQIIGGQTTGTQVESPLSLLPPSTFTQTDLGIFLRSRNSDYFRWRNLDSNRYVVFTLGGAPYTQPANLLSGLRLANGNNVLTSFSPRYLNENPSPWHKWATDNWQDRSLVGVEPIAIYFKENQTAVGFSLIYLNRPGQREFMNSPSDSGIVIKFYRRDGTMISQISFLQAESVRIAFARCGQAIDIAGIQITNSSVGGFAIDDIIFGLPEPDVAPQASLSVVQPEDDDDLNSNPLDVLPCSFNVS